MERFFVELGFVLLFWAFVILVSTIFIKLMKMLPKDVAKILTEDNTQNFNRNATYLFSGRTFPLITKRFFENFNIFCEELSFYNYKYYNRQKKVYVIILKKFNKHGQTIAIYSPKRILFSEEKLKKFIKTFAFKLENRALNQNGTLLMFTRTKKSPYFDWMWSWRRSRNWLQQDEVYDLIKDT